jgi:hypothetical protein
MSKKELEKKIEILESRPAYDAELRERELSITICF